MQREREQSTPYDEQAKLDSIAAYEAQAYQDSIAAAEAAYAAAYEQARQDTINAINSYRRSRRYDSIIPK
jgi:hypothetical protein